MAGSRGEKQSREDPLHAINAILLHRDRIVVEDSVVSVSKFGNRKREKDLKPCSSSTVCREMKSMANIWREMAVYCPLFPQLFRAKTTHDHSRFLRRCTLKKLLDD